MRLGMLKRHRQSYDMKELKETIELPDVEVIARTLRRELSHALG